ncbi:MAG: hypothetical protein WC554_13750 [Clostridia bacterium]
MNIDDENMKTQNKWNSLIKYIKFEIKLSYKLKQMILKELCELSSRNSGIVYWENVNQLYYNIPYEKYNIDLGISITKSQGKPNIFDKNGKACGWEGGSMVDNDPNNVNRLIITEYDLNNILDELEKENFIKQDSSKTEHYHRVILQLKGKEFYYSGGYNNLYFIYKWIDKNKIEILTGVMIIVNIISIFMTHHLLKLFI